MLRSPRIAGALTGALVLVLLSCTSDGGHGAASTASTASASGSASTASPPPIPDGGKDCGTTNELAGWPTTMAIFPNAFDCIVEAIATGTPARMVVISPGQRSSGRKTADGYDVPTHRLVTWIVLGKDEVQQTTDLSEDGGPITTEVCTGLSEPQVGPPPSATGCRPA